MVSREIRVKIVVFFLDWMEGTEDGKEGYPWKTNIDYTEREGTTQPFLWSILSGGTATR